VNESSLSTGDALVVVGDVVNDPSSSSSSSSRLSDLQGREQHHEYQNLYHHHHHQRHSHQPVLHNFPDDTHGTRYPDAFPGGSRTVERSRSTLRNYQVLHQQDYQRSHARHFEESLIRHSGSSIQTVSGRHDFEKDVGTMKPKYSQSTLSATTAAAKTMLGPEATSVGLVERRVAGKYTDSNHHRQKPGNGPPLLPSEPLKFESYPDPYPEPLVSVNSHHTPSNTTAPTLPDSTTSRNMDPKPAPAKTTKHTPGKTPPTPINVNETTPVLILPTSNGIPPVTPTPTSKKKPQIEYMHLPCLHCQKPLGDILVHGATQTKVAAIWSCMLCVECFESTTKKKDNVGSRSDINGAGESIKALVEEKMEEQGKVSVPKRSTVVKRKRTRDNSSNETMYSARTDIHQQQSSLYTSSIVCLGSGMSLVETISCTVCRTHQAYGHLTIKEPVPEILPLDDKTHFLESSLEERQRDGDRYLVTERAKYQGRGKKRAQELIKGRHGRWEELGFEMMCNGCRIKYRMYRFSLVPFGVGCEDVALFSRPIC
jgi:hypothetical protein